MNRELPVFLQRNQAAIGWVLMLALVVYGLNYHAAKTLVHLAGVMSLLSLGGMIITGNAYRLKQLPKIRWAMSASLALSAVIVFAYTSGNSAPMAKRFSHDFILQASMFALIFLALKFNDIQKKVSIAAILSAAICMTLYGLIQTLDMPYAAFRISGSLDLPIIYASNVSVLFAGLSGCLFYRKNIRLHLIIGFIVFLMSLSAVISSGSRMPFIALLATTTPVLIMMSWRAFGLKRCLIVLTVVLAVSAPLVMQSFTFKRLTLGITNLEQNKPTSSVGMRLQMWSAASTALLEHPLSGVGVGKHNDYFAEKLQTDPGFIHKSSRHFIHLHNDWLNAMVWMGIPAGILFMLFALLPALWGAANLRKDKVALPVLMASSAYLLNGLTNAPSIRATAIILFLLVLALLFAQQETADNSSDSSR